MADVNKTVSINYTASTQNLERGLKKIPKITDEQSKKAVASLDKNFVKMEKGADRTAKKVNRQMKKISKSFAQVGAAVGAAAVGVVTLQQKFADLSNQLVDASSKTGIAVDTLAGLRLALEGSGLGFESMESGLIKFQQSMDMANRGSKNLSDNFKELGVEVSDSNGDLLSADSTFQNVVASLGQMENETKRNSIAMQLFGRTAGPALIQSGALQNLEQMTTFAKEFGVSLEQDSIDAMGKFQRAMSELSTVAFGTMQDLLSSIAGKDGVTHGLNLITEGIVFFGSVAGDVTAAVGQGFENVFGVIQATALALTGDVELAKNLISDLVEETDDAMDNFVNMFDRANDKVEKLNKLSTTNTTPQVMKNTGKEAKAAAEEVEDLKESLEEMNDISEELEFNTKAWATLSAIGTDLNDQLVEPLDDATKAFLENKKALEKIFADTNRLMVDVFETPRDQRSEEQQKAIIRLLEIRQVTEEELFKNQMVYERELAAVRKQNMQDNILAIGNETLDTFGAVTDTMTALHDKEIAHLQLLLKGELSNIEEMAEQGAISSEEAAKRKTAAEMNYHDQMNEFSNKSFKIQKALAIANVVFFEAQAIAKAFKDYGWPAGIPIAALIAAQTGAQIATISAQSPPKFDVGGMIGNSDSRSPDQMSINVLKGEAILDRTTVRNIGGEEGVRRLQNGSSPSSEVVVIQPFKHFDRFARSMNKRKPTRAGAGRY
jgi:hypothetical protein